MTSAITFIPAGPRTASLPMKALRPLDFSASRLRELSDTHLAASLTSSFFRSIILERKSDILVNPRITC